MIGSELSEGGGDSLHLPPLVGNLLLEGLLVEHVDTFNLVEQDGLAVARIYGVHIRLKIVWIEAELHLLFIQVYQGALIVQNHVLGKWRTSEVPSHEADTITIDHSGGTVEEAIFDVGRV